MAFTAEEISSRSAQAEEALKKKDYIQAVSLLTSITQESPDYAPVYVKLGSIWMKTETPQKALFYLKKAIELAPNDAKNWNMIGEYHEQLKETKDALGAYQRSLELSEDDEQILYKVLNLHRTFGNHHIALSIVQKLTLMRPKNITYLWTYAQILKESGNTKEALLQYNMLINKERAEIPFDAIRQWQALMQQYGRNEEVEAQLYKLMEINPKSPELMWLYGKSLSENLAYGKAISILEKAHQLKPDNEEINFSLGTLYYITGNEAKSIIYYNKTLSINPLHADALRIVGLAHKYTYGDDMFKRLDFATAYLPEMPSTLKSHLHYALGKAYDDVGELETAFEHFKKGGAYHSQGEQTEYGELVLLTDFVKNMVTKSTLQSSSIPRCYSSKPIFILGMPRSGTTLIEQVLSGIKGVYGAGELKYAHDVINGIRVNGKQLILGDIDHFAKTDKTTYADRGDYYLSLIEKLAPKGSKRIIDKMPTNFKLAGLINLILPNASIIHSRRHPVEICLSAYRLHFIEGLNWSDNLSVLGKYYRKYAEIMVFWKQVLSEGTMLEVRYEDMVTDLETQSRRLVAHIGMEWDSACLEFHKSSRAVNTASAAQVRKPIYQTSMNRWRKYEPYLKPLLNEIGDLVEEYESGLNQ